ncbi:MAG: hypothetical protein HRT53_21360 [Colwellia sp.]|nr:hypothetical protein [Colwellia sp.]
MTLYNSLGAINTLFIVISLIGIYSQLKTIHERKKNHSTKHNTSELLSLNQFSVSFLAYFSFFVYGYSIEPFNHYIVWPRLIASILVAVILYEIWRDRQTRSASICLYAAAIIFSLGTIGFFYGDTYNDNAKLASTTLIVAVTLLIAQGYYHQIRLIIRSGKTGAINLKMSQFILMMDISTIAFALTMSSGNGWPLLCLAIVSSITKLVIMYLFYWVKVSYVAEQRRSAT